MATKAVVDCVTGETTIVELTEEEVAFLASLDELPADLLLDATDPRDTSRLRRS